jgi:hypothetical protein
MATSRTCTIGTVIEFGFVDEHSYHMDYDTAAAKYVDAFMKDVTADVFDACFRAPAGHPAAAYTGSP